MKTGRKYGEKEKIQILIKPLIFCTLRIYIFSFYAFLFFRSLADAKNSIFATTKINRITSFFQIQTQWYPQNLLIPQLSNERRLAAQSVNKTDINDEEKIVIISIIWYLIATLGLLPPSI